MLVGFYYFNDFKYLILNFFRLRKQKILEIMFVLNYFPDLYHDNKGNLKITIYDRIFFFIGNNLYENLLKNYLTRSKTPKPKRAKSYFTGSAGSKRRNA